MSNCFMVLFTLDKPVYLIGTDKKGRSFSPYIFCTEYQDKPENGIFGTASFCCLDPSLLQMSETQSAESVCSPIPPSAPLFCVG